MKFNRQYSLLSVYQQSLKYYKTKKVDDKKRRAKLDIISAKITLKNNFQYDRSTKSWKQTGKTAKLIVMVSSKPISYKKNDSINIHKFPVTIVFENLEMGIMSPFKWRTGSEKGWVKKLPTLNSKEIANVNIRNQSQGQFLFELEWVLRSKNLLYGKCRANRPPAKTNPKGLVFMDKHLLFVTEKILINLLNNKKLINRVLNPVKK